MSVPATSNSTILGAAAEHYVMCQLLRRGKIAALAPAGVPDADIIVSDRVGSALAAVQVKARRDIGADGGWHMKQKHESMIRDLLFYCFVDFGKTLNDPPKCWLLPSAVVAQVLTASHQAWLAAPGKDGRAHKDHDMRRLLPSYPYLTDPAFATGWLDPFRDRWDMVAPVLDSGSTLSAGAPPA
ncbi:hypothetical protein FV229_25590 [Methylobacterium sp. WL120]|nr:hypothetical protein FV229_25590 [Methylobacterium sp. WL120]